MLELISRQLFERDNSRRRCRHRLQEAPCGCRQRTPQTAGHVDLDKEKVQIEKYRIFLICYKMLTQVWITNFIHISELSSFWVCVNCFAPCQTDRSWKSVINEHELQCTNLQDCWPAPHSTLYKIWQSPRPDEPLWWTSHCWPPPFQLFLLSCSMHKSQVSTFC